MHLNEREMYSFHDTRVNAGMIEIRPKPISIAKRRVQTPAFDVLSTISPFRAVIDCNSFNINRIGQPMCKCTFGYQNDERRRFNTSVVQFGQY